MNSESSKVTQRRIAELAGVSQVTVSLALRNQPKISKRTRQQIQTIARELGYCPNPLVSTVMSNIRTARPTKYLGTLAFIITFPNWQQSNIFSGWYEGASARAKELGYQIDHFSTDHIQLTGRRLDRLLQARGIQGLLIGGLSHPRSHLPINWSLFTAVAMGYSLWKPNLHRVVLNYFQALMMAFKELKRRSYQKIGLALSPTTDERTNHQWRAAFLICQAEIKTCYRVPPLMPKIWDEPNFIRWFTRHRPDAILVESRFLIKEWLSKCGQQIPKDIGVIELNWNRLFPHWTGIDQNPRGIGSVSIDLVVEQLQLNQRGIPKYPKLTMINCRWIEGTTIRLQG